MFKLEMIQIDELRKDAINIMTVLETALHHGVESGLTTFDILQFAVMDPEGNHIWKITGDEGVVAYGHTRSIHYPNYSALQIVTLANVDSNPAEWEQYKYLLDNLENTALEGDYSKVEVVGRLGWRKRLAKEDYNFDYAVFSKILGDNND